MEHRLFIVPDYSGRNGLVFFGSFVLHIVIIAFAGRQFYLWYNRDRIAKENAEKAAKRAKIDEWMNKQKK
jgi:hypothetical protein